MNMHITCIETVFVEKVIRMMHHIRLAEHIPRTITLSLSLLFL